MPAAKRGKWINSFGIKFSRIQWSSGASEMVRRSVIYMIQEKTRQNLIASLYKAEYLSELVEITIVKIEKCFFKNRD